MSVLGLLASGALRLLGHERLPRDRLDDATLKAFERLAAAHVDAPSRAWIDLDVDVPKHVFLRWLGENRPVVFHGSLREDIDVLKPIRMSRDKSAFGDQQAVYASDDPVWAMYFAVLRKRGLRWTNNGCSRIVGARDRRPRYSFAIDAQARTHDRLGPGVVYVLPRDCFRPEAPQFGVIDPCHWVGPGEIEPLAKLRVDPDDFPFARSIFLSKSRGEVGLMLAHWRARLFGRNRLGPQSTSVASSPPGPA